MSRRPASLPRSSADGGLGTAERAERVEVRWPDGTVTERRDVPARQFLRVRKGS